MSVANITEASRVSRTIAHHYYLDALDFSDRFDLLWVNQTHKAGQIKAFVDLLMACECTLKSHVMLSKIEENPRDKYKSIRKVGHDIGGLADLAFFSSNRARYDSLKLSLHDFSVLLRYSLEAHDTFFPLSSDWRDANINYSETIGCQPWVMSIRQCLGRR